MVWVLLAMGATLISAIVYRNHKGFSACNILKLKICIYIYFFFVLIYNDFVSFVVSRSASSIVGTRPSYYWQSNDGFSIILSNLFTLSTLLCGASVILVGILTEQK